MRPNLQTCRRSRTIGREEGDLILWLKFNKDFSDSSNYNQKAIANPLAPDGAPVFSEDNKYYGDASAHCVAGRSLAVSGQGAEVPNAHLLDFGEGDFTIEFHAKFLNYPTQESTLFDWGNLKLTNWSGVFSIYNPNEMNSVIDYYDGSLPLDSEFNHIAVVRRDGIMNLVINGKTVTEDRVSHQITGLQEHDNMRVISSDIDGNNSFQGYIDEFKVHRSAIYGPEPCEVFDDIQVDGIILDDEGSADEIEMEALDIHKGRSSSFRVDVSTEIDNKSNPHVPLSYEVHWFKGGKDLFDSPSGPSTEAIYGDVEKIKHKNLIKIKNLVESGLLKAKVFFKKIDLPSEYSTFLNSSSAQDDFGEYEPLVLYWSEDTPRYALVANGENGSISVRAFGGVGPYEFTWKRNGIEINDGPNVSISNDGTSIESTITFLNVTHNISGITCEVQDGRSATSELYTEGSVLISTPKIIPPIVMKLHPSDSSRQNLILKKYRIESSEHYHLASYQFGGWPAENVMFDILAVDVNSVLSNVGELKYEWYVDGKWTSGSPFREFSLQAGQQSQVKCRIGFTQIPNIYTHVIANINYPDDACELTTSYFSKNIPSDKTREELTVYTGEVVPFSYHYVSSQDLANSSQDPKKFIPSTNVNISAGVASSILNLNYGFSDDYLKTIDKIDFQKKFWFDENDNNGEQNVKLTFSNSCGDKELISKIKVIKGKSVNGEINSGKTIVIIPNTTQQDQILDGWISPASTKKRRIYYRVLINGTNVSDYRPVPEAGEKLVGSEAAYKSSCLELSFVKASTSSAITSISVKLNDQSPCWSDEDTLTLEFYNNLPAKDDFANADKFLKTFTVRVVDPPEIDSPSRESSRWTLVNQSSQASNGKEINITWAYDHDNSEWFIYPQDHNSPEFNETFSQVPSAR